MISMKIILSLDYIVCRNIYEKLANYLCNSVKCIHNMGSGNKNNCGSISTFRSDTECGKYLALICNLIYCFAGAISSPQWGTQSTRLTKLMIKSILGMV